MKQYKKIFTEADANVSKIIKDLINTNWSGSVEEKMKAVSLLKGLATSKDKMAVKFMKDLDAATTKMKADNYKESFGKRNLKEGGFTLREFTSSDFATYSGVKSPANALPMIGFFDLYIDREYQLTFDSLGYEIFKDAAVIIDSEFIQVVADTSEDIVFSKKLGFGWSAFTNAIQFVTKTFRDGITINDLIELGFDSSIDLG